MLEFFMMPALEALIVFGKRPDPHHAKTRLAPALSSEAAAELYACFLADTLAEARQVRDVDHVLAYDPPGAEAYFTALAPDFRLWPQPGSGLGERMHQALAAQFSQGYQRVVLIGSDLPHLSNQTNVLAFDGLRRGADVVLGPSADGGYYLVGLTRPQPELFDLPMSTPEVLRQTLERVERLGLQVALLPESFDVDTPADLERLRAHLEANPAIPVKRTRAWLANS
jgi:rSAM/selenodomain-associated transferase 1